MPFTNAHHGGAQERLDLPSRIDAELRARIEDAVDYACLDAMVRARAARGEPAPAADNAADRAEYAQRVLAFLEHVRVGLVAGLGEEPRRRLGARVQRAAGTELDAALAVQVLLAKELPNYWQRFDALRQDADAIWTATGSGGQRGRLLDRLLGR